MSTQHATKQRMDNLLATARAMQADNASLANFLIHTINATNAQDLAAYSAEEFTKILEHSFAYLGKRKTGEHAIHIWKPEPDDARGVQIIDIFLADIPFVVDSILAAIRAMGGTVRLFIHPVLPVNTETSDWQVREKGGKGIRSESFLQIHIDPFNNEVELAELYEEIDKVLIEVRRAVRGWRPMLERLRKLVQSYRQNPPDVPAATLAEMLHFLAWLADHNFTFLGMREYKLSGSGASQNLTPITGSGCGILEDSKFYFLRDGVDYVEMTEQHVVFLQTVDPIMVTKANVRSRVHRRGHMDYIGVKLYDNDGKLSGELRIIGLFTSMSLATPHTEVPIVRRKVAEVMRRSGHEANSHAGKALLAALDNYPREELFQIGENELFNFATLIAALPDRPQVRVLPRIDRFDNFVSILMFLPRDRYDSEVREKIGDFLAAQFDGRISAYYPHFPEGELVRVHYIIGRNGGATPRPRRADLETAVIALTRSFGDRIAAIAPDPSQIAIFKNAFSKDYQSAHSEHEALADIQVVLEVAESKNISSRLIRRQNDGSLVLKVYHADKPVPLSDRVPMLEHFGFRVIDERSYTLVGRQDTQYFLHEMHIEPHSGHDSSSAFTELDADVLSLRLQRALQAIWQGNAESDGFDQLVITADLDWDEVTIIRAFSRYLRQMGVAYSQKYIWTTLNNNSEIARSIVDLFFAQHDPGFGKNRDNTTQEIATSIVASLNKIASIDEDKILRHFLNLAQCALRTNFFQRDEDGNRQPALSIKFDSQNIDGLPAPKPYREIFVYSPRVEGVHLRGGAIARGGLRWSDRAEDFRTEVLGLVKAQMTKNAVIVPLGAKGGFVPKRMPVNPDRETFMAEGTACYKIFIGALLDITDNLDGETIVTPKNVMRHDGDDPYLVVAADKGTATFSDTANEISERRDFWLGDAFASGGSVGYDHKKMGITARGAWEAVKRHFRELDRDIQTSEFTAVGVGDMSGDVFGNGMLLSKKTKLIAAFDHRDIFVDPDPDPAISFEERRRVFEMGRSSWKDYNKGLLSAGGQIYPRDAKSIQLSPEVRKVLNISTESVTPQHLMQTILRAKTDLLWFGGIGTYVRANSESNLDVGDRANDAIRITAEEVGAKSIGEGANLGITQLARIEYALAGGCINTDAIDNSAGVNSSDLEVNIKIALASLVRNGSMNMQDRNDFLADMTDEVAELCLRNNYMQTLTLSLVERQGMDANSSIAGLMRNLEKSGDLDRAIEFLPDETVIADRAVAQTPFTRPELSILLAYAKNALYAELLASNAPDDPYLGKELYRYFPSRLTGKQPQSIETHRLRREVIATVLANAMINRGGPAFVDQMTSSTSADAAQVAFAYAAARDAFGLAELNAAIDKQDNKVKGNVQLALYAEVQNLLVNQTLWFLRNVSFEAGLSSIVDLYASGIEEIRNNLADLLPPFIAESVADQAKGFEDGGTPRPLARRIAELSALTLASDIVHLAAEDEVPVAEAADAYFAVLQRFRLGRITEQSGSIALADNYDRMALDRALANLMRAQRDISSDVLVAAGKNVDERMQAWDKTTGGEVKRIEDMVTQLTEGELTVSRLSVAAGLLSDLARY